MEMNNAPASNEAEGAECLLAGDTSANTIAAAHVQILNYKRIPEDCHGGAGACCSCETDIMVDAVERPHWECPGMQLLAAMRQKGLVPLTDIAGSLCSGTLVRCSVAGSDSLGWAVVADGPQLTGAFGHFDLGINGNVRLSKAPLSEGEAYDD